MKTQILTGIALLTAGIYTVELKHDRIAHKEMDEFKVLTTEEIIEQTSLNKVIKNIEMKQDSVEILIRESVSEKVVDSLVVKR